MGHVSLTRGLRALGVALGTAALGAVALGAPAGGPESAVVEAPASPPGVPGPQPAADGPGSAVVEGPISPPGDALAPLLATEGGPGWQALPAVATSAREAAEALADDPVETWAWGDPSLGCFVLALRLEGGGEDLHRALRDTLGQGARALDENGPAVAVEAWQLDEDGERLASRFAFATGMLRGQARVVSRPAGETSSTLMTACFYSEREPARSARACARLLPAVETALQTIPEEAP